MTAYDRVLDALRDHGSRIDEHHGRDAHAQCPAHDDGRPSLHVTGIEGQALVYCHAQCSTEDVLAELRMIPADLFDEPAGAAYQYVDTTGELLRTVKRSPDKRFKQQVHDKSRVVLYRLPEVAQAVADERRVWLVEGEKDSHLLESLGEVATTAPQGSASFKKVDVSPLKGATVRAVVDRDEAGKKWADLVAATVGPIADLEFLEAAHGKDVTDHIMAGGTLDDLATVAVNIPKPSRRASLTQASKIRSERLRWLQTGIIPLRTGTIFAGQGGEGKSTYALHVAAQVTRGTLNGDLRGTPRNVLIVGPEDDWPTVMVPRLKAAGADLEKVYKLSIEVDTDGITGEAVPRFPLDVTLIREAVKSSQAAMLILDPAPTLMQGNSDKSQDVRESYEPIMGLAREHDMSVVLINHFNKGSGSVSQKMTGSHAWRDLTRSFLAFAYDEESEKRIISQDKNNYGVSKDSYEFLLESVTIDTDDGEQTSVARVNFLGASDLTVSDIINRGVDSDDEADEVGDWLLDYLDREPFEFPRKEIVKAARAEGFSEASLKRAKNRKRVEHDWSKSAQSTTVWKHPRLSQVKLPSTVPDPGELGEPGDLGASSSGYQDELGGSNSDLAHLAHPDHARGPAEPGGSDSGEDVDLFGDPMPRIPRADGKCDDCGNPLHKGRCVRCEVEGRRSA